MAELRSSGSVPPVGSMAYNFGFGYGASNLYGPEPEVVGFAVQTRSQAQSRAAYRWAGGHYLAEEAPEETYAELHRFFTG